MDGDKKTAQAIGKRLNLRMVHAAFGLRFPSFRVEPQKIYGFSERHGAIQLSSRMKHITKNAESQAIFFSFFRPWQAEAAF